MVPKLLKGGGTYHTLGIKVKLQKQTTRKIGDIEYSKWVITIPPDQIEKLKWLEGDNLDSKAENKNLVVKKVVNMPEKPKKMTYEEFKSIIRTELEKAPEGLTWTEIKNKRHEFYQKVPNNLWVRMLEKELGMIRKKELDGKTIWRLKDA